MAGHPLNPAGICAPLGPYSQGVLTEGAGRWLHIAGQVGVSSEGELAQGFEAQAHAAWRNIQAMLEAAGMNAGDLVKVVTYVTDESQLPLLGPVRMAYLGEARPAATLVVVRALARPQWLIEVEASAYKPA